MVGCYQGIRIKFGNFLAVIELIFTHDALSISCTTSKKLPYLFPFPLPGCYVTAESATSKLCKMLHKGNRQLPERNRDRHGLRGGEGEVDGLEQLVLRHHVSPVRVPLQWRTKLRKGCCFGNGLRIFFLNFTRVLQSNPYNVPVSCFRVCQRTD